MAIDTNALLALTPVEKLQLVELLWDDLGDSTSTLPLPAWIEEEGLRRKESLLTDEVTGVDHESIWRRIESRND